MIFLHENQTFNIVKKDALGRGDTVYEQKNESVFCALALKFKFFFCALAVF
jgi:hypothetical protein